jgi:cellulose synthase (UDP-forming)
MENNFESPEFRKAYERGAFLETKVSQPLIVFNVFMMVVYFAALIYWAPAGHPILYPLLIAGQIFHLWQLLTFLYTIWETEYEADFDPTFKPAVDVFVTVAGEPVDIVEETVKAALAMNYPNFTVYVLNDGFVAKKDNWREIEMMADRLGAKYITRQIPGGAKAGNINHASRITGNPYIVVFDADQVPHPDFLQKTMGYFTDPKMGFVQSPQFYKNHDENEITQGSWEQQALFFGPICKGKNRLNSVTMCGTNMVIRREALEQAGGIRESIAEDFVTGLFIHQKGWKSFYVAEVLAEGLAPQDFLSYYKQQFRWARGSLDVLFRYNFLFKGGLTAAQKIQYLSSVGYFISGLVVILNAIIPLIFFYTGIAPLQISTMALAAMFIPYIFVTIYVLQASTNFSYSFRSLAFSMAGFNIHLNAIWASMIGKNSPFNVTSKRKLEGNFLRFVIPQMIYVALVLGGIGIAVMRENFTPSVISNVAWAVLNVVIFSEFIQAAMPKRQPVLKTKVKPVTVN